MLARRHAVAMLPSSAALLMLMLPGAVSFALPPLQIPAHPGDGFARQLQEVFDDATVEEYGLVASCDSHPDCASAPTYCINFNDPKK